MASTTKGVKASAYRLLILAPTPTSPSCIPPFPNFLNAVTGTKPSGDVTSFAGYTSHPPLRLKTKYYQSDVNLWCDELPPPSTAESGSKSSNDVDVAEASTLEEWKEQMLSSPAAEVRKVIGGLVLVLPVSTLGSTEPPASFIALIETVHALREMIEDESYGRDVAAAIVLQGSSPTVKEDKLNTLRESLEERCLSDLGILGWDFVAWSGDESDESTTAGTEERNEFGEQIGIRRVLEVIQGVDWSASPDPDDEEDDLGLGDEEDGDLASPSTNILGSGQFTNIDHELQREMMDLKLSMLNNGLEANDDVLPPPRQGDSVDEDFQVNQLPALMEQVVAIREAGLEMAPADRERFARREIQRIMNEMG